MKKFGIYLALLFSVSGFLMASKSVAITQIVEHPALDSCRKGVKDALEKEGFIVGKNLKWLFENAQGQIPNTISIAKKFAGKKPDVIVAIATPSAQAVVKNAPNIPLVFSAITDPIGAGLVTRLKKPGKNITGVSDLSPMGAHLDLVQTFLPSLKRLGVVYNSGEANSITLIKLLKKVAKQRNIKIVEAVAIKTSEVLTSTRSLIGKVDAIYIPTDNTIISAFEAVVKVGRDAKIPVFAGDTASVKRGAVAALGFDYYDVGLQTGKMVAKILKGEKAGSINVETVQKLQLSINISSAKKMGIKIPNILISLAHEVIQ
jgi:putative ABC transport system substrate-binding protein